MNTTIILTAIAAFLAGVVLTYLAMRVNLQHQERVLGAHTQRAADVVAPLTETLHQLHARLTSVEKERTEMSARMMEQISAVKESGEHVRREAHALSAALRTPQIRGAWGEQSLRRLVEISGMTMHCDFDEQPHYAREGAGFRPDMRITMPDHKMIFVDSKVPLQAVLDAYNTPEEAEQMAHVRRFAGHVAEHIKQLSAKRYWDLEAGSPEFVVLFLPSDEFYRLALEQRPDLHDVAARHKITLACPGTLIPLLHAVSHGWKQQALAESAREISALGRELHTRVGTLASHFTELQKGLTRAVEAFNSAVGNVESRVLVTARKLKELHVASEEIAPLPVVEPTPREVSFTRE